MEQQEKKTLGSALAQPCHTVDTLAGLVVITPDMTLNLEMQSGWAPSVVLDAHDGLRVWAEQGLMCDHYPGPIRLLVNCRSQVVVLDQRTGELLGAHRSVDVAAISAADVGHPGVIAVLQIKRAQTYKH